MPDYQTIIYDPTSIIRGSGMIEFNVVTASPTWPVKAGAITGLALEEEIEEGKEENDNAAPSVFFTKRAKKLTFTKNEALNQAFHALVRGTLDTITETAGSLVSGATQILVSGSWIINKFYPIEHQNGDKTVPTIVSVVGSIDGALAENDDYDIIQNEAGVWGIVMQDFTPATTLSTLSQNITITYDYTPNASWTAKGGKNTEIPRFMCRITCKNDNKTFHWIGYYGRVTKGLNFPFAKDDDADRRVKPTYEMLFENLPAGQGASANENEVFEFTYEGGME